MHWKHSIKHSYHPGGSKYLDQDTNIMSSSFCWCFRVCHANTSVWIDLLARAGVGVSYASLSEDKNILSYQQQRVKWHVNSTLSRWGEDTWQTISRHQASAKANKDLISLDKLTFYASGFFTYIVVFLSVPCPNSLSSWSKITFLHLLSLWSDINIIIYNL